MLFRSVVSDDENAAVVTSMISSSSEATSIAAAMNEKFIEAGIIDNYLAEEQRRLLSELQSTQTASSAAAVAAFNPIFATGSSIMGQGNCYGQNLNCFDPRYAHCQYDDHEDTSESENSENDDDSDIVDSPPSFPSSPTVNSTLYLEEDRRTSKRKNSGNLLRQHLLEQQQERQAAATADGAKKKQKKGSGRRRDKLYRGPETGETRCAATTTRGKPCSYVAVLPVNGSASSKLMVCHLHRAASLVVPADNDRLEKDADVKNDKIFGVVDAKEKDSGNTDSAEIGRAHV